MSSARVCPHGYTYIEDCDRCEQHPAVAADTPLGVARGQIEHYALLHMNDAALAIYTLEGVFATAQRFGAVRCSFNPESQSLEMTLPADIKEFMIACGLGGAL